MSTPGTSAPRPLARKIWLDCDPGHDDAIALLLAIYLEEVELVGISTVSREGNWGGGVLVCGPGDRLLLALATFFSSLTLLLLVFYSSSSRYPIHPPPLPLHLRLFSTSTLFIFFSNTDSSRFPLLLTTTALLLFYY